MERRARAAVGDRIRGVASDRTPRTCRCPRRSIQLYGCRTTRSRRGRIGDTRAFEACSRCARRGFGRRGEGLPAPATARSLSRRVDARVRSSIGAASLCLAGATMGVPASARDLAVSGGERVVGLPLAAVGAEQSVGPDRAGRSESGAGPTSSTETVASSACNAAAVGTGRMVRLVLALPAGRVGVDLLAQSGCRDAPDACLANAEVLSERADGHAGVAHALRLVPIERARIDPHVVLVASPRSR